MGIAKDKKRHEVNLKTDVIDVLSKIADKENRSLKNLMENILMQMIIKKTTNVL